MAHTAGKWEGDSPFVDAKIVVCPEDIMVGGAAAAVTRNAVGDYSLNMASSLAGIFGISLTKVLERLGNPDDLQENFGTATPGNAAGAGPAAFSGNQGGPGSVSGRPPFTGASQLTPLIGNRLKGFKLTDVTVVYQIGVANLTIHTVRVDKVTYVDNVALATSVVLAAGANGLAVVQRANPYVTKVLTPLAVFNQTDNSDILIEIAATTPATSTYRLYRVILHGQFNFA